MQRASMNQLVNVRNPFQGEATRVLCVCSAGLLRSPTIASVLHTDYKCNVRAAGVSQEYALVPVTEALLHWADIIVCADDEHQEWIEQQLEQLQLTKRQVFSLGLPDRFSYNDAGLREEIRTRLEDQLIYKAVKQ